MLSQLSVKNLAVVEALDLSFEPGMSTVTGETGAGKSILLQALNLALGHRSDSTLVRHGQDKAEVSAAFDVAGQKKIQNYLQEQSLEEDGECILRRIISSDGRSKAFVNGVNVPLSIMKAVGELLIDMHGQNEHQLLLRNNQQRDLLDAYTQSSELCDTLNTIVSEYNTINSQINELSNNQDLKQQQQELLQHQLQELKDSALTQDELDTIEHSFKTSANASSLLEKTTQVLNQLEQESGANAQLLNLSHVLNQALETDEKLAPIAQMLSSAQVQTQETIYELNHYLSSLSFDEQTTAELEARLSELHDLARKHTCQITELITTQDNIAQSLQDIGGASASLDGLQQQKETLAQQYHQQAKALSKVRLEKASLLSNLVTEAMQVLGMPGSVFKVDLPKKALGVHYNGDESVDFLVQTNMGSDFKALKKVASGGELSRISLAISVVSSDSEYTPTLIFDEVDVGISGAVAEVVGQKLKQLSQHYQIICITHLAQVAAFGHQHLRVQKAQEQSGAQTTVAQLSDDQRVDEIARILGGSMITDKTRTAAAEMISLSV
ncbi:DNA repair protein RecN [thiotrophic endosymbiont of Bathymodiolus puteoserpentis (Logatchev)]|uniref:DNA repair protein RecN n=1 Tax=thiotrophic endosymbiont of Bathymodiolus puteoserpentis (Logatchev) TaxID=343240 RepID=UPI0010B1B149|nr:DNA repair protein RecN [thiotrophic endosymbiont of Bathymodiolus puteoserpentis (Logatchev)]SSC09441.1 DNA repair protein RecN [thiotrophic endosymbiont of Bathymodiolus puteoserpentis (Logatchev)]